MTLRPTILAAAALAPLLLAGCGEKRTPVAAPDRAAAAQLTSPGELDTLIPEADVEALTEPQRAIVARFLDEEFCYCGCPHTVSACVREHGGCVHAKRMAWLAVRLASAGLSGRELAAATTDYYASFERGKRARIDVAAFGPPLGNPEAPITLVEYSDFTCPFCQQLRPRLEAWVEKNRDRVKLYFKPFPIESHTHALEAAQAGEWAREQGIFWPMHDRLFENPDALAPEALAEHARELGQDGDALAKAIAEGRYADRIRASKSEARAAGITGTPTLFFQGRRLALGDFSDEVLDLTLADEEEWQRNRGWAKD